jgi:hypothetical protein
MRSYKKNINKKYNGKDEAFSAERLYNALNKAGAYPKEASEIVIVLKGQLHTGNCTASFFDKDRRKILYPLWRCRCLRRYMDFIS